MDETRLQSSSWLNTPVDFSRAGSGPPELLSGTACHPHLAHGERVRLGTNAVLMFREALDSQAGTKLQKSCGIKAVID